MAKFTYDDTVKVLPTAPAILRPGELASVVAVNEGDRRSGAYYDSFPPGPVYTIEFEDGASADTQEALLEKSEYPNEAENRKRAAQRI